MHHQWGENLEGQNIVNPHCLVMFTTQQSAYWSVHCSSRGDCCVIQRSTSPYMYNVLKLSVFVRWNKTPLLDCSSDWYTARHFCLGGDPSSSVEARWKRCYMTPDWLVCSVALLNNSKTLRVNRVNDAAISGESCQRCIHSSDASMTRDHGSRYASMVLWMVRFVEGLVNGGFMTIEVCIFSHLTWPLVRTRSDPTTHAVILESGSQPSHL